MKYASFSVIQVRKIISLKAILLLSLLLAACAQEVLPFDDQPSVSVTTAALRPVTPLPTVAASPTPPETAELSSISAVPLPNSTATERTPLPTVNPTATPDPLASLSIDALAARSYGGGEISIVDTLERNERFARYLISYPSDGLRIAGFMNVPNEGTNFPVAIVLHGYIPPSAYETLAYTQRYADALVAEGYFVIHPNLRNYPPSDSGPDRFRTGMAVDVLNLIAIIQQQSQDPEGLLRRAAADDINLLGHSMGGSVALRVVTVNNDDAIRTAVLYGAMSGDEKLNYGRILEWSGGRRGEFELAASEEALNAISPVNYLDRIKAAISIHHSDADEVVPLEWSLDLCRRLQELEHPVKCHIYNGAPHTFNGVWDEVFTKRFIRFFDRY